MNGYEIKKVLYEDNEIYAYIKGNGDINYVFISGWAVPAALADMCELADEMSNYGKCIIIDRFGYGNSSIVNTKRNLEQISKETEFVLDNLGIKNNIIMVGHSLGTFISVEYTKYNNSKVKGLVLIDSYPTRNWFERSIFIINYIVAYNILFLKKVGYLERIDKEKLEKVLFKNHLVPEDIKNFAIDITRKNIYNKTVLQELKGFINSLKVYYNDFENLKDVPITCICREETYKKNLIYKEKLDQVKIVCSPESSHFIHYDHKDLVLEEIKAMK